MGKLCEKYVDYIDYLYVYLKKIFAISAECKIFCICLQKTVRHNLKKDISLLIAVPIAAGHTRFSDNQTF